jgi:hydroxyacylglutathione hydrolase
MYFRQILHEAKACASYIVGCPTVGLCSVIDPQGDPQKYVDQIEDNGMALKYVIETHVHADHLSSARELAASSGAKLYYGPDANVTFRHAVLRDGDVVNMGRRFLRIMHTPGHTPEHICLYGDDWFLLTGDMLFVNDVGRVDLSLHDITADEIADRATLLYRSLQKILALPDYIEVYPGHYSGSVCGRGLEGKPSSTIGFERRFNPALQLSEPEFVKFQIKDLPPLPDDFRSIKLRNIGRSESTLQAI